MLISIHAPRTGSDGDGTALPCRQANFNPRSPHGERPLPTPWSFGGAVHFNPRSPHGERLSAGRCPAIIRQDFNPRSPHGERRSHWCAKSSAQRFQSTLPARGATYLTKDLEMLKVFQSTLPARGATQRRKNLMRQKQFQSTLPARGATQLYELGMLSPTQFQSTLPARGATHQRIPFCPDSCISIHAPRTGSDGRGGRGSASTRHFNPRSPHGERPGRDDGFSRCGAFQSTLPARGAT